MVALIENLQRQDLDFIEEAKGIGLLMERYRLTQEQAAQALGKSQSGIANKLRLLRHSEAVLRLIRRDGLTERHARALLRLPTDALKFQAIEAIRQFSMTVQRADSYIDSLLETEKPAVLRCPRCFKTSAAEKVESINQQMLLCPECKKVSPAVKFYPRKRK